MLSPDPYVQVPEYSQNFNRYSYVMNTPPQHERPHRILMVEQGISQSRQLAKTKLENGFGYRGGDCYLV